MVFDNASQTSREVKRSASCAAAILPQWGRMGDFIVLALQLNQFEMLKNAMKLKKNDFVTCWTKYDEEKLRLTFNKSRLKLSEYGDCFSAVGIFCSEERYGRYEKQDGKSDSLGVATCLSTLWKQKNWTIERSIFHRYPIMVSGNSKDSKICQLERRISNKFADKRM